MYCLQELIKSRFLIKRVISSTVYNITQVYYTIVYNIILYQV